MRFSLRSLSCSVPFVAAVLALGSSPAFAVLTADQAACVNTVSVYSRAVSTVQSKANSACVKAAGKDKLTGTVADCLTADPRGKLTNAKEMLLFEESAVCPFGGAPYGYQKGVVLGARLAMHGRDLLTGLFGSDLDGALVSCATDAAACACQAKAEKAFEKLLATGRSVYRACKKAVIPTAASAADFVGCLTSPMQAASVESDTKGRIAKAGTKLQETLAESCTGAGVAIGAAFPGDCSGQPDAASLANCLSAQARCRLCGEVMNAEDATVDCDAFDDGVDNASCRNFRFKTLQNVDDNLVTCSSVTTTATYTQCDDFKVSGFSMPNGFSCVEDWYSVALPQGDVDGFCTSLTSGVASEKYLACDSTQQRWIWQQYQWQIAPLDDNGFLKNLRCYY